MNQKDYKEIAKIIKKIRYIPNAWEVPLTKDIAKELADYFEKESNVMSGKGEIISTTTEQFNRKRFLKDCGVEK